MLPPKRVVDYLSELTIERRSPACLLVGKDGLLRSWSNTLDYGIMGLEENVPVEEQVDFLVGLLPLQNTPVVLPCVSTSTGWPAEVHLFPSDEGDWVVLLDAKAEERQRWLLQQKANELDLLRERQARLIEELDAFAHTVAHDLKGPLATMIGFADLLRMDGAATTAEKRQLFVDEIYKSGHRMNRIIEELLLLAGVRQKEIEIGPVDMAKVVAESLDRLSYTVGESNAEIVRPDSWPEALGYAPWVEEVWANYVSNAIKYGGKPPRVELGATVQSNGMVRFWVRDNGPGIPAEARSRLFTPHTRLDVGRAKGHGLGLSIVRRIVAKLGGDVGVDSAEGQGSTFSFTLRGPAQ